MHDVLGLDSRQTSQQVPLSYMHQKLQASSCLDERSLAGNSSSVGPGTVAGCNMAAVHMQRAGTELPGCCRQHRTMTEFPRHAVSCARYEKRVKCAAHGFRAAYCCPLEKAPAGGRLVGKLGCPTGSVSGILYPPRKCSSAGAVGAWVKSWTDCLCDPGLALCDADPGYLVEWGAVVEASPWMEEPVEASSIDRKACACQPPLVNLGDQLAEAERLVSDCREGLGL